MNIVTVLLVIIISSVISIVIKQFEPGLSVVFSIFVCAGILVVVFASTEPVISELYSMGNRISLDNSYIKTIIKSLGICYLTEFTTSLCKDAGQTMLASKAEFAGKIAMLLVAFPVIRDVLEVSLNILEG